MLTPVLFATIADAAETAMLAKNQVIFNIVPHGPVPHMHHQCSLKCWQALTLPTPCY